MCLIVAMVSYIAAYVRLTLVAQCNSLISSEQINFLVYGFSNSKDCESHIKIWWMRGCQAVG